jgi:alpha 1,3-glucosidase
MRVREIYGTPGTAYEQPRVVYDELVLEAPDLNLKAAHHAAWIRSSDNNDNNNNKEGEEKDSTSAKKNAAMIQTAVRQLQDSHDSTTVDNFMALQYGDAQGEPGMLLLMRLEPFAVYLFRESNLEAGPIVTLGTEQMMHFEVRRFKDESAAAAQAAANESAEQDADENTEDEPEKEIVGYWEDGLKIYADGTREEKKVVEVDQDHRKLTESELDREGLWEESFSSHHDSKPFGPMSVGMDIVFPKSTHLYGLPEHAASTVLQTTQGQDPHFKEPYRLYNLDVFQYELDETMALYGAVPLIVSQSAVTGTMGVLWFNPTETYVDVMDSPEKKSTKTHWMSESGVVDVFFMPGPDPKSLYRQYATLSGVTPLPPIFSLGYHQCRWNYKDEKDIAQVHADFEKYDYPYDVLWLDIEHTDGKKYFTWDPNLFPTPIQMQEKLAQKGRRMVTIVDPHIKRDDNYYIHKEATAAGLYVKDKDGVKDYDGWCWPGSSSYLDFTSERVRSWWADQFSYVRYRGSTSALFTWNDMNEPSVFNGPEVSMQKDLKNLKGEEHREWHNLYGMLFHRATSEGQIRRNQPDENIRPFVLSRSFFVGSQRYGAIWTGDNAAEWGHLEVAAPMLLSLNVAALSFVGADVGGFFGDPDAELFTRWMQAGAYQPFFRGHAHHDSKRREPWVFGEETLARLRKAAMARYALLPYWYGVFHEAEMTGMPVMRMMWMEYPETEQLFSIDDQYLIGSDLLVKPVTGAGATMTQVLFPSDDLWYDVESLALTSSAGVPKSVEKKTIPSGIDYIPVFQRGGSIIPRKLRLRRSTMTMRADPYTLYVALDSSKKATGTLYMDDEESFGYKRFAEFAKSTFTADLNGKTATFVNSVSVGAGWAQDVEEMYYNRMIERIVIMGAETAPKAVTIDGEKLDFSFSEDSKVIVIRKPDQSAMGNFTIALNMSE